MHTPRSPVFLSALLLAGACAHVPRAADAPIADLAIRDVTVIDGTGGAPLPARTVLARDGRIAAIVEGSPPGAAAREVDGRGRFLIPGLIDGHCHPSPAGPVAADAARMDALFAPLVRFGVTSAVLYGGSRGSYASMERLARRSARGELDSPRIFHSSPIVSIEGAHPVRTYTSSPWVEGESILVPRSLADVDAIVEEAAGRDTIGVKIVLEDGPNPPFIEPMSAAWVRRFVQRGAELGVPIYAHVSDMPEVRTCVDAGVYALVHYWGVVIDWERDAPVIERMAERDISWVTTLVLGKGMVYYPQHLEWLEREELRAVFDPELLDAQGATAAPETARALLASWTGDPDLPLAEFFAADVAGIAEAHRRGVNVVLGTDMGNTFVFPGLVLHEEMELLQAGGMRPPDILRMGTLNAAQMIGRDHELGSIEVGKRADLVLLAADPSVDLTNALAIRRVFIGGVERAP